MSVGVRLPAAPPLHAASAWLRLSGPSQLGFDGAALEDRHAATTTNATAEAPIPKRVGSNKGDDPERSETLAR